MSVAVGYNLTALLRDASGDDGFTADQHGCGVSRDGRRAALRLDAREGVTLQNVWIVRRMGDGKDERGRTAVREPVPAKDYEALAAGHSRTVSRLSDDIDNAVRSLDRSGR